MWGTCLKRYEKESFLKSFTLFFSIQMAFLSMVMWQDYKSISHQYDMKIMNKMTQCSFTLECPEYEMDFIEKEKNKELNKFYQEDSIYMLFSIPTMDEKLIKFSLTSVEYEIKKEVLKVKILKEYLLYALFLLFISIFFARYSIRPLKEAFELNDEFVKDMLHDFNTPIASLKINFKILEKQFGQNASIKRSEEAMKTIANLQSNMGYFLSHSPLNEEKIKVASFVEKRVQYYEGIFPEIVFKVELSSLNITTNPEALSRILDNLLSNACKYNIKNGTVSLFLVNSTLIIEDTGIGIRNPKKVFERFYKETSRGMGIGLHVVQKLCEDLDIGIKVESQLAKGTRFSLNFEKVMFS
ncbi:MAG: Two-component sensor histidine kinase [uncultured Sulfurovum sp.]|uniref:histidine kinase n=1 Tax=uncultured Sulfurovum sp. TaxID=269237 RepID=A0A6S6SEJ5_9BACT|nr:MAG: Two-component sensor histidine kinase [uncultured Sulfurovum sp.]